MRIPPQAENTNNYFQVRGLKYLMEDVRNASYKLHQERWFRKGFYDMEKHSGTIGLQELKKYMQKINCKVSTSVLRDKFNKYDTNSTGEIGKNKFFLDVPF